MRPPIRLHGSMSLAVLALCGVAASVNPVTAQDNVGRPPVIQAAGGCKQASSCEEAVQMWCGGYSRADADHDGIPCENVCHSLEQVQKIKNEIGC